MTVDWPEQRRVDELRLDAMIAYCPLCARPCGTEPMPPAAALQRLSRHLWEAHDPYFGAILRVELGRPAE